MRIHKEKRKRPKHTGPVSDVQSLLQTLDLSIRYTLINLGAFLNHLFLIPRLVYQAYDIKNLSKSPLLDKSHAPGLQDSERCLACRFRYFSYAISNWLYVGHTCLKEHDKGPIISFTDTMVKASASYDNPPAPVQPQSSWTCVNNDIIGGILALKTNTFELRPPLHNITIQPIISFRYTFSRSNSKPILLLSPINHK